MKKVDEFLQARDQDMDPVYLRAQVRALERRVRAVMAKEQVIVETVQRLLSEDPPPLVAPKPPKVNRKKMADEEVAILHLSDTQLGKITKSYDTAVCEQRVLLAMEKAIEITNLRRSLARIDELRVYLGGDMIEGEDIFPHQAHEIDSSLFDQAVINFPRIAARALLRGLEEFRRIKVLCVAGNHGRNGPKSTRSNPKTNWDRVAYEVLKVTLLGTSAHPRTELAGRLSIETTEDFWLVDRVFDWGNLIVHGHQIGGGFAGFPWYGTARKAWGWIDAIEQKWDNLFFGHFHTPAMATIGHRRFYANGTTESDNNFAKEQMAAAGDPCQRLVFMNAHHGVTSDALLYLSDRTPNLRR